MPHPQPLPRTPRTGSALALLSAARKELLDLRSLLKLFEKAYAPLAAGLLSPFRGDRRSVEEKPCQLDRLYQRISDDLDALLRAVGLKAAAVAA
jgi:hypothetical protein